MGRPVTRRPVRPTMLLCVALSAGLAGCSRAPARTPSDTADAPSPSDEMGEPHDQSDFAKDPSETHLMSPDEPDLHLQSEATRARPR